jgi:hypothetical protein
MGLLEGWDRRVLVARWRVVRGRREVVSVLAGGLVMLRRVGVGVSRWRAYLERIERGG